MICVVSALFSRTERTSRTILNMIRLAQSSTMCTVCSTPRIPEVEHCSVLIAVSPVGSLAVTLHISNAKLLVFILSGLNTETSTTPQTATYE